MGDAAQKVGEVHNTVNGGIFLSAVVQGRDITVRLPPRITPALSGLPAPSPAFTGRDAQVCALLEDLAPGGGDPGGRRAVLVTSVSGLAGIGKTELVIQTAVRALKEPGWFPGGVLFTDLFGYDPELRLSPERALEGLLRALGIPGEHVPGGLQDRQRLYRSVLAAFAAQGQRILVVLDNASTIEQARPLLPTDGITAVLVTSRHTLDGLDARLRDLGVLDEQSSFDLLDGALRHARGDDDTRVVDDPDAAAAVGRLCAGLPLALRIASAILAARPTRSVAALAADLSAEHSRLDRLRRPDRAVRAAFELSHRLLDSRQAGIFGLMALNPGPDLSTDAAARLAGIDPDTADGLLCLLAEAHLIEEQVPARWRMHDLVRLYAGERACVERSVGEREAARERLFTFYRDTASAAATHLEPPPATVSPRFPGRAEALTWLEAERTNLVASCESAAVLGDSETSTGLAFALGQFLDLHRYFDDWLTVTATACALFRQAGDRRGEGTALNNRGLALRQLRRFDEAIAAHSRAADALREAGDLHGEGQALGNLGSALREVRRFDEATAAHSRAVTVFRQTGDRRGQAVELNNGGLTLRHLQRFGEAAGAHTEAFTIFEAIGDLRGQGQALANLGSALNAMGSYREAISAHRRAVEIHEAIGDLHGQGRAVNNLGSALTGAGRYDEAVSSHRRAIEIYEATGDPHSQAQALTCLGVAFNHTWRFDEAHTAHARAVAVFHQLGDRHGEGAARNNLAIALMGLKRFDEARHCLHRAVELLTACGDDHAAARPRRLLDELSNFLRQEAARDPDGTASA
ncbi:ATP-binding protein [Kitasatospora sp. NPDC101176]|uniref:ATP-binding protein n=1 Tax=Kitasatospora sp. NPDC101176 TaxID=3364099 RepID=UPI003814E1D7